MKPVDFSISLTTAVPPDSSDQYVLEYSVEQARLAESLGFRGAWILEHHFTPFGVCPSALTMASFLLGMTERLRVGTAVSVVTLDHPIRIAEQVALLDQLSGGRLDLGVGRGQFRDDFKVFGVDPAKTRETLREWMDIAVRAWTEGSVEASGDLIEFPRVPVMPAPRTKPHPPVYVAATSPTTVEWAASRGFGLLIQHGRTAERAASTLELYADIARSSGHDPDAIEHVLFCIAHVADTAEQAKQAVFDNIKWWSETLRTVAFSYDELSRLPGYEAHFRDWQQRLMAGLTTKETTVTDAHTQEIIDSNPIGTPDYCIGKLHDLVERTGIRHVVVGCEGAGKREEILTSMERFAGEVMPKVQ